MHSKFPLASKLPKVSSFQISENADGKIQDRVNQGVKRSRKATGHPTQSNKIDTYFLKHKH